MSCQEEEEGTQLEPRCLDGGGGPNTAKKKGEKKGEGNMPHASTEGEIGREHQQDDGRGKKRQTS